MENGLKVYENTAYSSSSSHEINETKGNEEEGEVFHRQGFQKFTISIVDSKLFGGAILFIILLNTIILIIQTDEETSVKGGKHLSVFIAYHFLSPKVFMLIVYLYMRFG